MPNQLRDIQKTDKTSFPYIFDQDVSLNLKFKEAVIRLNVYRPRDTEEGAKYPVLVTYGPYGKDVHYEYFNPNSYKDVPEAHKGVHAAWETPFPTFWTARGYVVVRADESGTGQSPGPTDVLSKEGLGQPLCELIEWSATQTWSTGKVGLLGISYYAIGQWHAAAQQPNGLTCIVPWEGCQDIYRDVARHGGIVSNGFLKMWYNRQVVATQYGRPGRAARNWGPDTIEGDLSEEELAENNHDVLEKAVKYPYRDVDMYASAECNLANIKVPLLSVANWGGFNLHLRGNVRGFVEAGSELKYLRFITGRHDLPFYLDEGVDVQRSFLDAFLKGEDRVGWSQKGKVPPIDLLLRKGSPGFNNVEAEGKAFPRRQETTWPLPRTMYTNFYLTPEDKGLKITRQSAEVSTPITISYLAPGNIDSPQLLQFTTPPFEEETEITGHPTAHINISMTPDTKTRIVPSDIDIFSAIRHIGPDGKEVFYTGTMGEPVPVVKGWLRVSLRKIGESHPEHRAWLPYRSYKSSDRQDVIPGIVYPVDVELWPTNVVVEKGGKLIFEISSGDTQGCGVSTHDEPRDRAKEVFGGFNNLHFSSEHINYLTLPVIPPVD